MKKLFILLYAGLASILPACETILPVDIPESEEWGITLNAVASPDTTFWAYVTHCYPNSEAPNYDYEDMLHENGLLEKASFRDYYHGSIWGPHDWDEIFGNTVNKILKKSTLKAQVELTVNGLTTYPMVYDTLMLRYQSNYTPSIGDRLEVRINSASGEQTVARTEIPQPQKLEIVETETELLENAEYIENLYAVQNRGYVKMKLRLHDPAGEKNYYRLAVRGITPRPTRLYNVWDIYLSSDPIFRDERLTSEWGAWPAFFSDVFDDSLINGDSYEFEIKTYVITFDYDDYPTYEVSLQSITEDYYHYLKSMQLYRISRSDTYSEGVYIHSNNEGGWGLLGGISGEVHQVEPFKDMNDSSDGNGSPTN